MTIGPIEGVKYMLYSKSDEVSAHWPRRTLGLIVHVSPHPRELNGETFKKQTNTTLGEHPRELAPRAHHNEPQLVELE